MKKIYKTIDDYSPPNQSLIDSLQHLQLVEIHWRGGNHGFYRVWVDDFNRKSAIVDSDFEDNGSIKLGCEWRVEAMVNYNPINTFDIWELKVVKNESN